MPQTGPPLWQDAHDALQLLKEQLDAAYEAAPNDKVGDAIDRRADAVDTALESMNQMDMAARTVALQAAAADLAQPLKDLAALKDALEAIAEDAKKAAAVLTQVDKLLGQVKSCFGI